MSLKNKESRFWGSAKTFIQVITVCALIEGLFYFGPGIYSALFTASDEVAFPERALPVTDLTGTLSLHQQQSLERQILALKERGGADLAVLLVHTTGSETLESFSLRVAETWKLGREGVDDGVLLLVAKDDRKLRIEVGYGLEGALTDVAANRIIRDFIAPKFKQGDYAGGIAVGVAQIASLALGEPQSAPQRSFSLAIDPPLFYLLVVTLSLTTLGNLISKVLNRNRPEDGKEKIYRTVAAFTAPVGFFVLFYYANLPAAVFGALIIFVLTRDLKSKNGSSSSTGSSSASGSSSRSSRSSNSSRSGRRSGGGFGGGGSSGGW